MRTVTSKKLWTFVVDFRGGTYVSQFQAPAALEAIECYNAADPSGLGAVPLNREFTKLEGVQNVLCATGLSDGDAGLILANIVQTVSERSE